MSSIWCGLVFPSKSLKRMRLCESYKFTHIKESSPVHKSLRPHGNETKVIKDIDMKFIKIGDTEMN